MTSRKTKTFGEAGPVMFRIKHVLVWTSRSNEERHWKTLENEVLLATPDWDKAVRKVRPKVGSHYSILAMIEENGDREKARRFVVGG